MSAVADSVMTLDRISKKFKRGEIHDSLRDLVPALTRRMLRPKPPAEALESREFWALKDVSFEVNRGEAFGIIGANGAGKSTILKLLSGIMQPTIGTIQVRGRLSALIEVSAGFHPDLTGRENIFLNGSILGMSRREIQSKFDEIVDFSGLETFIDTPVKRYSSGMFARLGFSVAAHVEPDVLIVDEVLSVGDYLFQQKCADRMKEITRGGTTVIFVSHNLHAVAELCPRGLVLERGRVLACGRINDVIGEYMSRAQQQQTGDSAPIFIKDVRIRKPSDNSSRFVPGEAATIDIAVGAREYCSEIAIVVEVVDDNHYPIFDTDTARLSGDTITFSPGERLDVSFTLDLHLGAGMYHVNIYAHQYTTDRPFTTWRSAATFFVGETRFVKGSTNLYPRIAHFERFSPSDETSASRLTVKRQDNAPALGRT